MKIRPRSSARRDREERPKTVSRLKQCNKSNRLFRRFLNGGGTNPRLVSIEM